MYIKAQTVIPAGTKITKCPPAEGKAESVYTLLKREERKLHNDAVTKMLAEKFHSLLKAGYAVPEALKLCQE